VQPRSQARSCGAQNALLSRLLSQFLERPQNEMTSSRLNMPTTWRSRVTGNWLTPLRSSFCRAVHTSASGFATEIQAKKHCPADIVVWVDTPVGIYHFKGMWWYADTRIGAYVCQKAASQAGYGLAVFYRYCSRGAEQN
jgi:hypothetical protein